jgi:hypothetical protein
MAALTAESPHHRARIAALKRCIKAGERPADDPELVDAQQKLAAAQLVEHIERIIADWPPLTDEQLDRIAALLRAGSRAGELARRQ